MLFKIFTSIIDNNFCLWTSKSFCHIRKICFAYINNILSKKKRVISSFLSKMKSDLINFTKNNFFNLWMFNYFTNNTSISSTDNQYLKNTINDKIYFIFFKLPVLDWDVQVKEERLPFLDKQIHPFQYIEYNYPIQVHYHKIY